MNFTRFAMHAGLIIALCIMLYPVVWLVSSSFKPENLIFSSPGLIPTEVTFENYSKGWYAQRGATFGLFLFNSFLVCFLAILGNLFGASLAGYAFARLNFRLKPLWFAIMLGSIMLPIHAQLVPQYVLFLNLGWVNTVLPLVVPKFLATDAFFVFLMVQFMRTLPRELEQAAEIDGATFWQKYWRIILPLSLPALVTTAVFTFIFVYNDFLSQLIYLQELTQKTVPLGLSLFLDAGGGASSFGGLMSMSVLSIGPVLGFFIASQRFLTRGIATQGLK
jgi:multiple sugar transport system permease protein